MAVICDQQAKERFLRGCIVLSEGRMVVTDRLHGHILCLLLGIPHIVMNNSYGKVESFYKSWTKGASICRWANSISEIFDWLDDEVFQSELLKQGVDISRIKADLKNCQWTTLKEDTKELWYAEVSLMKAELSEFINDKKQLLLVDDDLIRCDLGMDNLVTPFSESDEYCGAPMDSQTAIATLESKCRQGKVDLLAFAWTSFWWLNHYGNFEQYLSKKFSCILKNKRLIVFDINPK